MEAVSAAMVAMVAVVASRAVVAATEAAAAAGIYPPQPNSNHILQQKQDFSPKRNG